MATGPIIGQFEQDTKKTANEILEETFAPKPNDHPIYRATATNTSRQYAAMQRQDAPEVQVDRTKPGGGTKKQRGPNILPIDKWIDTQPFGPQLRNNRKYPKGTIKYVEKLYNQYVNTQMGMAQLERGYARDEATTQNRAATASRSDRDFAFRQKQHTDLQENRRLTREGQADPMRELMGRVVGEQRAQMPYKPTEQLRTIRAAIRGPTPKPTQKPVLPNSMFQAEMMGPDPEKPGQGGLVDQLRLSLQKGDPTLWLQLARRLHSTAASMDPRAVQMMEQMLEQYKPPLELRMESVAEAPQGGDMAALKRYANELSMVMTPEEAEYMAAEGEKGREQQGRVQTRRDTGWAAPSASDVLDYKMP